MTTMMRVWPGLTVTRRSAVQRATPKERAQIDAVRRYVMEKIRDMQGLS
jgi:hypothetical protein